MLLLAAKMKFAKLITKYPSAIVKTVSFGIQLHQLVKNLQFLSAQTITNAIVLKLVVKTSWEFSNVFPCVPNSIVHSIQLVLLTIIKEAVNVSQVTLEIQMIEMDAELNDITSVRQMLNAKSLKCASRNKAFPNAFQRAIVFDVDHMLFALLTIILLNANVHRVPMLEIQMILKKVVNKFRAFTIMTVLQLNYATD
jgi:hypothetical protein